MFLVTTKKFVEQKESGQQVLLIAFVVYEAIPSAVGTEIPSGILTEIIPW